MGLALVHFQKYWLLSLITWSKRQWQNLDNMLTTLVQGDSSDLKCYDSDGWKTLGSQKEVSCPNGTCAGIWTAEAGKLYYIK